MIESADARSRTMRAVRSRDTKPEMAVRHMAYAMGFRYRLHRKELPGKPDLVFIGKRKAVFVHGCFWHGHGCPRGARTPKENREYWVAKISRNMERDKSVATALDDLGWRSMVVWECELRDQAAVAARLRDFLGENDGQS